MKLPNRIIKIFTIIALTVAVTWGINADTTAQQAARARFSIEPHSGNFVVGNTINLSIYEECSQSGVNTLQANVIYDTGRLQFISASSPLALVPPENTAGRVPLAVYQIGGLSAGKHHVATVAFRVVAAGTTTISFGSDSAIIMPVGENLTLTQVWDGNTTGATFTLSSPTSSSPPPTSSTPATGSTPTKPTAPSSVPSSSKPASSGTPSTGGNAGRPAPQPSQQPSASPDSTTSPAVAGLAENASLVAVKIFGEGGKLLSGIKVTINNQTVLTDASGVASFVGLKPGTYKVKAIINGKEIEKFINVKGVSTASGVQEFSIGQKAPTPYVKIVILSVALVAVFIIVIFIIRKVLSKNNDYTGGVTASIITNSNPEQTVTSGENETTLSQRPAPDSGGTVGKVIEPTQVPEKDNTQQGGGL